MKARSLMENHGDKAEDAAMEYMFMAMEEEDVTHAALWLAIIQEIRQMEQSSPSLN